MLPVQVTHASLIWGREKKQLSKAYVNYVAYRRSLCLCPSEGAVLQKDIYWRNIWLFMNWRVQRQIMRVK